MGVRGPSLELDGERRKQKNLHGGSGGIPEGPGDAVSVTNTSRLQERCRPRP